MNDKAESKLSELDTLHLLYHLAALTSEHVELSSALRGIAGESDNSDLAHTMLALADQLENGQTLEQALAKLRLFGRLQGLAEAAVRSPDAGTMLAEYLGLYERKMQLWREVRSAVAYPALIIAMVGAVFFFIEMWIVPQIFDISFWNEFIINASPFPLTTRVMIWVSENLFRICAGSVLSLILFATVIRVFLGAVRTQRLCWNLPLFGKLMQWIGACEFCGLAGLILRRNQPLDIAIQVAGATTGNPCWVEAGDSLAKSVRDGQSLAVALQSKPEIPAILAVMLAWGERQQKLSDVMYQCSDLFETWVRLRLNLLQVILPPLTFILAGFAALHMLHGLSMPLFKLISELAN